MRVLYLLATQDEKRKDTEGPEGPSIISLACDVKADRTNSVESGRV